MGITFACDEQKARINIRRHGTSFEQAAEVFFDPFLIRTDASRNDEARDAVIGEDSKTNLLFVVHIEIGEDSIRLISARKATRKERLHYENG